MASLSKAVVLQRRLGDHGKVQPYRNTVDRRHDAVGWWATPGPEKVGCSCRFCAAARGGDDVYLGYDLSAAAVRVELTSQDHEAIAVAA